MAFDIYDLEEKTTQSTSGGGYTTALFIPKSYLLAVPNPSVDNKAIIVDDLIFKPGKAGIPIFTDDYEFELNEESVEGRYNDAHTSTLTGLHPGDNIKMREFINDGISSEDGYMLINHCYDLQTLMLGKGKCCAGTLKVNFKSGKVKTDSKGFDFVFTVLTDGVSCIYQGVGAMTNTYSILPDITTPDVSQGTATYVLPENTVATEITTLANAVPGTLVTLEWASTSIHSTLAVLPAVFQLTSAFTPVTGAKLVLQVTSTGAFAERHRYLP